MCVSRSETGGDRNSSMSRHGPVGHLGITPITTAAKKKKINWIEEKRRRKTNTPDEEIGRRKTETKCIDINK